MIRIHFNAIVKKNLKRHENGEARLVEDCVAWSGKNGFHIRRLNLISLVTWLFLTLKNGFWIQFNSIQKFT